MNLAWWIAVGALLLLGPTLYLLRRARSDTAKLRLRLEDLKNNLERMQASFSRFAPDDVVDSIISSGVSTSGEKREVTILFADLVGFTALSEQLEPEVLVQTLNGYFSRMSRIISEHRGHVSKFIGDEILALFGALQPNPWQTDDAARAALAMRDELDVFNRDLAQRGVPTLQMGVGIHRGSAVAGVIGSQELVEFTVIGRNVNLASRVETLTRDYDEDILVTEAVKQSLAPGFVLRELPAAQLRGIHDPVVTYALTEWKDGN